ncbi:hypothetical protein GGR57DRAFT_485405 [Xylariaceae sp. FL1272]|nr:hypothetical protein GGR57DRAFT_485405 [Xylariaceae sp. FL1272]
MTDRRQSYDSVASGESDASTSGAAQPLSSQVADFASGLDSQPRVPAIPPGGFGATVASPPGFGGPPPNAPKGPKNQRKSRRNRRDYQVSGADVPPQGFLPPPGGLFVPGPPVPGYGMPPQGFAPQENWGPAPQGWLGPPPPPFGYGPPPTLPPLAPLPLPPQGRFPQPQGNAFVPPQAGLNPPAPQPAESSLRVDAPVFIPGAVVQSLERDPKFANVVSTVFRETGPSLGRIEAVRAIISHLEADPHFVNMIQDWVENLHQPLSAANAYFDARVVIHALRNLPEFVDLCARMVATYDSHFLNNSAADLLRRGSGGAPSLLSQTTAQDQAAAAEAAADSRGRPVDRQPRVQRGVNPVTGRSDASDPEATASDASSDGDRSGSSRGRELVRRLSDLSERASRRVNRGLERIRTGVQDLSCITGAKDDDDEDRAPRPKR